MCSVSCDAASEQDSEHVFPSTVNHRWIQATNGCYLMTNNRTKHVFHVGKVQVSFRCTSWKYETQLIKVSIFMLDAGDDMCFAHIKGAFCTFLDPESLNFEQSRRQCQRLSV